MREHILLAPARRAFDAATSGDQQQFDQIFLALCTDPSLAAPIKTVLDVLPVSIYRYNDGEYLVAYDLPDDATLRIWMIGKAPDLPRPR